MYDGKTLLLQTGYNNTIMKYLFSLLFMLPVFAMGQTLEECQLAAEANYPLIRHYGLIEKTMELTVSNIRKRWLPQVSATAQATLQSDVTAFPDEMEIGRASCRERV